MMRKEDHYQILGVSRNAPESEIRAAYRMLARRYHPDKTGTCDPEKFKRCAEAFEILSNPGKKKAYDESLRFGSRCAEFAMETEDGFDTFFTFYRNNKGVAIADICSRLERKEAGGFQIVGIELAQERATGTPIELTIQLRSFEADRRGGADPAKDCELLKAAFVALGANLIHRNEPLVREADRDEILQQIYRIGLGTESGLITALDQPQHFAHLLPSGQGLHVAKHPIRSGFLLANCFHSSCVEVDFASYLVEALQNDACWRVVHNKRTDKELPALILSDCRLPYKLGDVDCAYIARFYKNAIRILLGKSDSAPAGIVQATLKNGYRESDVGAFAITDSRVYEQLRELKAVPTAFASQFMY